MLGRNAVFATVLIFVHACASSERTAARSIAWPPELSLPGQGKCSVIASRTSPLVVEWPSAARGDLEIRMRKGVIAVRYAGCSLELLPQCEVPARYAYNAFEVKRDHVVIRDADDLYASVPLGAAKLEGVLQREGQLDAELSMVGKYEANRRSLARDELGNRCEGATHLIVGLTVGAFTFSAGSETNAGAEARVLGLGGARGPNPGARR